MFILYFDNGIELCVDKLDEEHLVKDAIMIKGIEFHNTEKYVRRKVGPIKIINPLESNTIEISFQNGLSVFLRGVYGEGVYAKIVIDKEDK